MCNPHHLNQVYIYENHSRSLFARHRANYTFTSRYVTRLPGMAVPIKHVRPKWCHQK